MINLQKEGALVSLTVSSLLDAGLWGALQKAGPAPRARAAEDGSFPDAQLWSLSGLGFLAAFVLGHHNSTFLFPTDFEDGLDHRKCSTDHRPTCAYPRHVHPTQPDREQPSIPQQCKLQQSASKPALKLDWTAKTKTEGAVHWRNKPSVPPTSLVTEGKGDTATSHLRVCVQTHLRASLFHRKNKCHL